MHKDKRKKLINKIIEDVKKEGVIKKSDKKIVFKNISSERARFGKNKKIPKQYEKHVLKAISYYPELKDEKISFEIDNTIFFMEARFKILSLINGKRHYVVKINKRNERSLLKLSDETIVAMLCHELAHIADYKRKNLLGIIHFGIRYLIPTTRRKIEIETDIRAILHGSGNFILLRYDEIIRNLEGTLSRKMPDKFIHTYYYKYYLRKEEIEQIIKNEQL